MKNEHEILFIRSNTFTYEKRYFWKYFGQKQISPLDGR